MVLDTDELMITTDKGQTIRMNASDISVLGRNTQGVRLITLNPDEKVTGIATIGDTGEIDGDGNPIAPIKN